MVDHQVQVVVAHGVQVVAVLPIPVLDQQVLEQRVEPVAIKVGRREMVNS
jgi:hypothetical protein